MMNGKLNRMTSFLLAVLMMLNILMPTVAVADVERYTTTISFTADGEPFEAGFGVINKYYYYVKMRYHDSEDDSWKDAYFVSKEPVTVGSDGVYSCQLSSNQFRKTDGGEPKISGFSFNDARIIASGLVKLNQNPAPETIHLNNIVKNESFGYESDEDNDKVLGNSNGLGGFYKLSETSDAKNIAFTVSTDNIGDSPITPRGILGNAVEVGIIANTLK